MGQGSGAIVATTSHGMVKTILKQPWAYWEDDLKRAGELSVGDQIGKGSSYVVFKAIFKGENVAAKEMFILRDPGFYGLQNTQDIKRLYERGACLSVLLRELCTHQCLPNHPHICEFRGVVFSRKCGEIDAVVPKYVLLALADGGTLKDYLREGVDSSRALQWAKQIADAVAFLHACKPPVIHRDLKPANILIHEGEVKIADFGFSRQMPPSTEVEITPGVGTYAYTAPEILDLQTYNFPADVYSMIVMIFEMLGCELPGASEEIQTRIATAATSNHPALQWLLESDALADNPLARPTAKKIAKKLAELIEDQQDSGADQFGDAVASKEPRVFEFGKMPAKRTSQHCWKPGQGRVRRHLRSVFCVARN